MTFADAHQRLFRCLLPLLLAALLGGCGPTLQKVVREDPSMGGFVAADAASAGDIVSVTRGGRALAVRTPLMLQPGDIIETGAGGAVLRLDKGEAVLAPHTRVRLGSLEVLFGRVLANVRGLFRVEDEAVAADVEGTRFMFDSQPGRALRVVVLEGAVRVSSRTGAWTPQRVTAGQRMSLDYRASQPPRVERANPAEMDEIRRWSETIRNAPTVGYCCAGGQVVRSLSSTCRGRFEDSLRAAQAQCERGWCCQGGQGGQVFGSLRADCRGSFHADQRSAVSACTEPSGWCCSHGHVGYLKRSQCAGQFFGEDSAAAKRACTPAPPPPNSTGTVTQPPNRILKFLELKTVWCCLGGDVLQLDVATCQRRGGVGYPDRDTAIQRCVVIR